MNDFAPSLGSLLDEVAAGIDPTPDFDAARAANVPVVPNGLAGGRRFRTAIGVAAVSATLLAGGVAASQLGGDEPASVMTTDSPQVEAVDRRIPVRQAGRPERPSAPAVVPAPVGTVATTVADHELADASAVRTAELGTLTVHDGRLVQAVHGSAAVGEAVRVESEFGPTAVGLSSDGGWHLVISLTGVAPGQTTAIRVSYGWSDVVHELSVTRPVEIPATTDAPKPAPPVTTEPPKQEPEQGKEPAPTKEPAATEPKQEEPKEQPPVVFTSKLGSSYQDETYLKQVFHGTAPAGSTVTVASDWGSVDAVAGPKGGWEMRLVLTGVPDGAVVVVEVGASTGGSARYELVRKAPAPVSSEFTSNLGEVYDTAEYFKPVLYGTGVAGSVVQATSDYGSATAEVGHDGHWELWFKMFEVPNGPVAVRVTNSRSESVFEYPLERHQAPQPVSFTAQAAYVECDSTPPYNEYWGTAPAGATITIASAYGGKQVTAGAQGHWEARVEFPDAPVGETFVVTVSSSSGGPVKELPFRRVEPA